MATTDVFNNSANNYVNPNLSICEGTGGGTNLVFLPDKSIAIVQGTNVLESISFADIKIPVDSFTSNRKILQAGEVTFIQGLAKGLTYRSQSFTLPDFGDASIALQPYFMTIDLSVGFYKNFGYKMYNLEASANYTNNISIDAALNVTLSNIQSKISSSYDPSDLTFIGTQEGWDFDISNVILTLIDASASPFGDPSTFNLVKDLSTMVSYAKYPNSAMQGIIMKITYPPIDTPPTTSIYDEWIYVSHVPDAVTIYESIQINPSTYYQSVFKNIDIGKSGSSDSSTMSAGDYLEWITDNEEWQKVGEIYIWLSTPDYSDTYNLIDGFYAYNPHDFPVQLEYMTIV